MEYIEFRNNFTRDCDKRLKKEFKQYHTYLIEWDPVITGDELHREYAIRVSGATRGCLYIEKETNLVSNIVFDEYTCFSEKIGCYEKTVKAVVDKWIGKGLK